jgi:hypothetical protein
LFVALLNKIALVDCDYVEGERIEKEIVNSLKIIDEAQEPVDWLLYKNGAKNSVFTV